jgi:hypothetical protein
MERRLSRAVAARRAKFRERTFCQNDQVWIGRRNLVQQADKRTDWILFVASGENTRRIPLNERDAEGRKLVSL